MQIKRWLVIRADGDTRILTKNPAGKLRIDEIAVPILVTFPEGWGRVVNDQIDIHMPQPPSFEPDEPIVTDAEDGED